MQEFEDGQDFQKPRKPEGKSCVNAQHRREAWAGAIAALYLFLGLRREGQRQVSMRSGQPGTDSPAEDTATRE